MMGALVERGSGWGMWLWRVPVVLGWLAAGELHDMGVRQAGDAPPERLMLCKTPVWRQSIGCEVALHTRRRLRQAWGVGAGPMVVVGLAIAACLDVAQPGSRGGIAALGGRHAGDTP